MATNFPTSQDNFTNPTSSDTLDSPDHAAQHADVNDAVEALQAKVGVDSSAVTTSHDYKIAQLEANAVTDHGALTGLSDDDHTQYLLADGTRTATDLTVSNEVESSTLRLTSTVDAGHLTTGHAFQIGTTSGDHLQIDDNGIQQRTTAGNANTLHLQKNGGEVRIGNSTDASFYINTLKQGDWVSFTPVPLDYTSPAYTASNAGTTNHSIGTSNFYYTATLQGSYHLSNNQCRARYYGAYASGNLTNQPYYSLPFLPDTELLSQVQYMGWGRMQVFMGSTYLLRPQIRVVNTGSNRRHANGEVEVKQYPSTSFVPTNFFINTQFGAYGNNPNSFTSGHVYMEIVYTIAT